MIDIPTTRNQEGFGVNLYSYSSSYTSSDTVNSLWQSMSSNVSVSAGVSITILNSAGGFQYSFSTGSAYVMQEGGGGGGGTTSMNATLTSYSSSSSSSSSYGSSNTFGSGTATITYSTSDSFTASDDDDSSFTQLLSYIYATTASTGTTSTVNTSTATTTDSTKYTILSGSLSTTSATTDITAGSTYTLETSTMVATSSSAEFATYIEYGDALSSERNDWMWFVTNAPTVPGFIADIAHTVDATTLWPDTYYSEIVYATAAQDDTSRTTVIPGETFSLVYNEFNLDLSTIVSFTSGASFSRDTVTTTVPSVRTTTESFSWGQDSSTAYGVGITEQSTTTVHYSTVNQTVLYPVGYQNYSTSELLGYTSFITTTNTAALVPYYVPEFSSEVGGGTDGGATTQAGATQLATAVFQRGTQLFDINGGASAISPVAPVGCFIPGSNLRSAANPYQFASNLSLPGTRIPYYAVNSVFSNAVTPSPFSAVITGSNSHTFRYSWPQDTLKITEQDTYLSGAAVLTTSTITSGVFGPIGDFDHFYEGGDAVWGGFPAIPTAAESVWFGPRGVEGTSIAVGGESSTYRTIVNHSASTEISERILVESVIPAYVGYTIEGGAAGNALLVYPRNPDG